MYSKGETIRGIAILLLVLDILAAIVGSIMLFTMGLIWQGFMVIIMGIFFAWFPWFILDALAEVLQQADITANKVARIIKGVDANKPDDENLDTEQVLEKLEQYNDDTVDEKQSLPQTRLDKVKDEIKHVTEYDKAFLKERNFNATVEIKQMSLDELYDIVENKKKSKEFIYLCCFEIIKRESNVSK